MSEQLDDLSEFIILRNITNSASSPPFQAVTVNEEKSKDPQIYIWTRSFTLNLIEIFQENRKKVGTLEVKSLRRLWQLLAELMKSKYGVNVTPSQCENRWRVLERNYKKLIDNNNKTGRGRIHFEFEKEMEEILGHKKSVKPLMLLSSESVCGLIETNKEEKQAGEVSMQTIDNEEESMNTCQDQSDKQGNSPNPQTKEKRFEIKRHKVKFTRNDILEKIRCDKLKYNTERLSIEKEKILLEKQKFEEKKRKNDLIEERNALIRRCIEKNIPFPNENI
ncbi:uncharacterized protein [Leptinotarsa decemlineata]|uniref:uncharacterized protein n=1 Tax=Leptinotarsa decemlineata TaxID=7539 RepID=UPI003D30C472